MRDFSNTTGLKGTAFGAVFGVRPLSRAVRVAPVLTTTVVVAVCGLVYASQAATKTNNTAQLPAHVADTREAMLAAVRSASLDDLMPIIEASQTKPDFGIPPDTTGSTDPVTALKALSADGRGHDILAAIADVLDVAPATLPLGKDLENNLIYVWPYLAERPLDQLSASELVDLYRLAPHANVVEMREKKRWLWWRLVIGADGSWLMFKKPE